MTEVFNVRQEQTPAPGHDPVAKALYQGVFGLATNKTLVAKNGAETAIDYSAAPIEDDSRNVTGVVVIFRETADRKS